MVFLHLHHHSWSEQLCMLYGMGFWMLSEFCLPTPCIPCQRSDDNTPWCESSVWRMWSSLWIYFQSGKSLFLPLLLNSSNLCSEIMYERPALSVCQWSLCSQGKQWIYSLMQMCILYCDPSLESSIQSGLKYVLWFISYWKFSSCNILNMLSYQIFFYACFVVFWR